MTNSEIKKKLKAFVDAGLFPDDYRTFLDKAGRLCKPEGVKWTMTSSSKGDVMARFDVKDDGRQMAWGAIIVYSEDGELKAVPGAGVPFDVDESRRPFLSEIALDSESSAKKGEVFDIFVKRALGELAQDERFERILKRLDRIHSSTDEDMSKNRSLMALGKVAEKIQASLKLDYVASRKLANECNVEFLTKSPRNSEELAARLMKEYGIRREHAVKSAEIYMETKPAFVSESDGSGVFRTVSFAGALRKAGFDINLTGKDRIFAGLGNSKATFENFSRNAGCVRADMLTGKFPMTRKTMEADGYDGLASKARETLGKGGKGEISEKYRPARYERGSIHVDIGDDVALSAATDIDDDGKIEIELDMFYDRKGKRFLELPKEKRGERIGCFGKKDYTSDKGVECVRNYVEKNKSELMRMFGERTSGQVSEIAPLAAAAVSGAVSGLVRHALDEGERIDARLFKEFSHIIDVEGQRDFLKKRGLSRKDVSDWTDKHVNSMKQALRSFSVRLEEIQESIKGFGVTDQDTWNDGSVLVVYGHVHAEIDYSASNKAGLVFCLSLQPDETYLFYVRTDRDLSIYSSRVKDLKDLDALAPGLDAALKKQFADSRKDLNEQELIRKNIINDVDFVAKVIESKHDEHSNLVVVEFFGFWDEKSRSYITLPPKYIAPHDSSVQGQERTVSRFYVVPKNAKPGDAQIGLSRDKIKDTVTDSIDMYVKKHRDSLRQDLADLRKRFIDSRKYSKESLEESYKNNNPWVFSGDVPFARLKEKTMQQMRTVNINSRMYSRFEPTVKQKEAAFKDAVESVRVVGKDVVSEKQANEVMRASIDNVIADELSKMRNAEFDGHRCESPVNENDEDGRIIPYYFQNYKKVLKTLKENGFELVSFSSRAECMVVLRKSDGIRMSVFRIKNEEPMNATVSWRAAGSEADHVSYDVEGKDCEALAKNMLERIPVAKAGKTDESFDFRKPGGPDAETVLAGMVVSLAERYRFARTMSLEERASLCVGELRKMGLKNMQHCNLDEAAVNARASEAFATREREYVSQLYHPTMNLREKLVARGLLRESAPQKGDKRFESLSDYGDKEIDEQKNKNAVYLNKLNGIFKAAIEQRVEPVGESLIWSFFVFGMKAPVLTVAFELKDGVLAWSALMNGREITKGSASTTEWNLAKDIDSALKKVLEGMEVSEPAETGTGSLGEKEIRRRGE